MRTSLQAIPSEKSCRGLSNFYMVGQWVEPGGGRPTVYKSGRDLSQIICRKDGRAFKKPLSLLVGSPTRDMIKVCNFKRKPVNIIGAGFTGCTDWFMPVIFKVERMKND